MNRLVAISEETAGVWEQACAGITPLLSMVRKEIEALSGTTYRGASIPALSDTLIDNVYAPLAAMAIRKCEDANPYILGISGAQGSGKTTAARVVQAALENLGLTVVTFSMDDLYLTYDQRQDRASKVHPLFATRSVPGTHDIELGIQILDQLERGQPVTIPAFDKSAKGGEGDRIAKELWDQNVDTRADVVIVEGWCLGAPPIPKRELDDPINAREAEEDPDKIWRTEINTQLKGDYHRFFEKMDDIVFFQVPDIETVYENRNKQEQQLGEAIARRRESGYSTDSMGTMSEEKIRRFIQLFERLTLHMMKRLPGQVTMTVQFDRGHKFRELVPKTPSTS